MEWNNKFTYPKSTRSIINGSRHYNLEGSNLPSVTTILKATQSEEDKASIAAWKERVLSLIHISEPTRLGESRMPSSA